MGWTPKQTGSGSASRGATPPSPRRRRRAPDPLTPRVDQAVAASPRRGTGARPRGGVNTADQNKRGEDPRKRDVFVRLGKRWAEIVTDIKANRYTWAEFVEGLDEEELARGQLKDNDGGWKGRPPALVPREFHLACQREMKRRFEQLFQDDVLKVAKEYLKMAQSKTLKDETKAKMLQYAMERVFGGIPKDVRVSQEAPWEQMVVNVLRTEGETGVPDHLRERYTRYSERQGGGAEAEEE
jgi:hypothetical protein